MNRNPAAEDSLNELSKGQESEKDKFWVGVLSVEEMNDPLLSTTGILVTYSPPPGHLSSTEND